MSLYEWKKNELLHVFAIRILAFSMRFGEFTAIVLSRMKPGQALTRESMEIGQGYLHQDRNP